jgi:asparagine synthase (glutamine-hydrolysing)
MCGIFGVIKKSQSLTLPLKEAIQIIKHRGPNDSGYLLWRSGNDVKIFADEDTDEESRIFHGLDTLSDENYQVAFGHRRLSILDLSPAGHQPMLFRHLSLCYNGEIYNYLEIREELIKLGREFKTQSDSEVILQAWHEWGEECLQRFNGMFAFLILDSHKKQLYVVRDRFGVKPLYYTVCPGYIAFASEIKQLRVLPEYSFQLNNQIAFDYLRYGYLDHESDTFEKGIFQVDPSQIITIDLDSLSLTYKQWYVFEPRIWEGTLDQAEENLRYLLKDATKLRLRSDVPVGSALSGGLDSSTIVCLMRQLLDETGNQNKILETVTSCSLDKRFDETHFAEIINAHTQSISHKVYPSFEKLQDDLGKLIWHMDYPFGSTSQFSQWCVFEGASQAGLTVMIDGQGADEQLAGYGGNDLPFYTGLFRAGKWGQMVQEAIYYKSLHGNYPIGFLLGAFQSPLPTKIQTIFPNKWQPLKEASPDWINSSQVDNILLSAKSLRENLINQIKVAPLPSLLRYEDRNSMAFSVESRTPFMDYRLMEFTLGLPERMVLRNGERKFILRKSFRGIVPDAILDRKDKMGFVSAEERWLKEDGKDWFLDKIMTNNNSFDMLNDEKILKLIKDTQNNQTQFSFDIWRIINFKLWYSQMSQ